MKCPLTTIVKVAPANPKAEDWCDCIKEECAWWDVNAGGCSVYLISRSLMYLFDVTVDIKEKMPHEAQFRR